MMFNRILAFVRTLSVDQVILAGFDAETSTVEGKLAGVSFVVNVSLGEQKPTGGGS